MGQREQRPATGTEHADLTLIARFIVVAEELNFGRATALTAVAAAVRSAQRAGAPHLVLAVKPGGDGALLPAILARYEAAPGAIPVDIVFSATERSAMLRDGRADLALLHRPRNDLTGLDTEDLLSERSVVLVPGTHRLARRGSVRLADLREDPRGVPAGMSRPGRRLRLTSRRARPGPPTLRSTRCSS